MFVFYYIVLVTQNMTVLIYSYISYLEVCQPPPAITNGMFTLQGGPDQTSGAVATYQCNDNFALVGDHLHTCVNGSTWDLTPPTCSRMGSLQTFR